MTAWGPGGSPPEALRSALFLGVRCVCCNSFRWFHVGDEGQERKGDSQEAVLARRRLVVFLFRSVLFLKAREVIF